ncbi:MAG: metallophosphoesterase [Anaerovoracaceae bacterium]
MSIVKVCLASCLYLAMAAYVISQLDYWLRKSLPRHRAIQAASCSVFGLAALLPFSIYLPAGNIGPIPVGAFRYRLVGWGNVWLGLFWCIGGFMVLFHVLRVAFSRRKGGEREPFSDMAPLILLICFGATAAIFTAAYRTAMNLQVTHYEVRLADSDAGTKSDSGSGKVSDSGAASDSGSETAATRAKMQEKRIVFLSDLHLGCNSDLDQTRRLVRMVNAQHPDLILLGGDLFSDAYEALAQPQKYIEVLSQMHAHDGIYGVYGNHDVEETLFAGFSMMKKGHYYRDPREDRFLAEAGITMLEDSAVVTGGVEIIGRRDEMKPIGRRMDLPQLLEKAGDSAARAQKGTASSAAQSGSEPQILLAHEPENGDALRGTGLDLVLSGHTHGGQIVPWNYAAQVRYRNVYGKKTLGGVQTIVSSGTGFHGPPMRLGTHAEICVVDVCC